VGTLLRGKWIAREAQLVGEAEGKPVEFNSP